MGTGGTQMLGPATVFISAISLAPATVFISAISLAPATAFISAISFGITIENVRFGANRPSGPELLDESDIVFGD